MTNVRVGDVYDVDDYIWLGTPTPRHIVSVNPGSLTYALLTTGYSWTISNKDFVRFCTRREWVLRVPRAVRLPQGI